MQISLIYASGAKSAEAKFLQDDSIIESVTLSDTGDGVYIGDIPEELSSGDYQLDYYIDSFLVESNNINWDGEELTEYGFEGDNLSYVSLLEANEYFKYRINCDDWFDRTSVERFKALVTATNIIDSLEYVGEPATEEHAFPRVDSTIPNDTIPNNVIKACCEIAYAIFDADLEGDADASAYEKVDIGKVSISYRDGASIPEYKIAGVPCSTAWRLLSKYLYKNNTLKLERNW